VILRASWRRLLCLLLDHETGPMADGQIEVIHTTDTETEGADEYGVAVCWCSRCEWPVVRVLKLEPLMRLVDKGLA
jgi:hypothetical protein